MNETKTASAGNLLNELNDLVPSAAELDNPAKAMEDLKPVLNRVYNKHVADLNAALASAIEYGGYLTKAQALVRMVGKQTWTEYVAENLPIKPNMAGIYLKIFAERSKLFTKLEALPAPERVKVTVSSAAQLLATPREKSAPAPQQNALPQKKPARRIVALFKKYRALFAEKTTAADILPFLEEVRAGAGAGHLYED